MDANNDRAFSPQIQELIGEFLPIIRKWDVGKYAVSVGGSLGKGTWDNYSDVDFRFFHEKDHLKQDVWTEFFAAVERWKGKGINVDGIWPRSIDEINSGLDRRLNGEINVHETVWCIWGYQLLTDIRCQTVIEDPYGVIADWKKRLQLYPPKLKAALLNKHLESLRYWRNDYHYRSKVKRGDVVFLAGISSRLVHDMMQVLFALNETYFVGDGQNIKFSQKFQLQPNNFAQRVKDVLYPSQVKVENVFETQYAGIMSLIDDILPLAADGK
jgi:hypothetical protein